MHSAPGSAQPCAAVRRNGGGGVLAVSHGLARDVVHHRHGNAHVGRGLLVLPRGGTDGHDGRLRHPDCAGVRAGGTLQNNLG